MRPPAIPARGTAQQQAGQDLCPGDPGWGWRNHSCWAVLHSHPVCSPLEKSHCDKHSCRGTSSRPEQAQSSRSCCTLPRRGHGRCSASPGTRLFRHSITTRMHRPCKHCGKAGVSSPQLTAPTPHASSRAAFIAPFAPSCWQEEQKMQAQVNNKSMPYLSLRSPPPRDSHMPTMPPKTGS